MHGFQLSKEILFMESHIYLFWLVLLEQIREITMLFYSHTY